MLVDTCYTEEEVRRQKDEQVRQQKEKKARSRSTFLSSFEGLSVRWRRRSRVGTPAAAPSSGWIKFIAYNFLRQQGVS